jgi:sugar (pentulose or hexulose) kinase
MHQVDTGSSANTKILLGIDIGTQGAKAILVSSDGNVLGQGRYPYSIKRTREEYAEQDPEKDWWNGCQKAIAEAFNYAQVNPERVSAIGFSTQTSNVVLVDKNGNSIRPAIIWQDRRSTKIAKQIGETLAESHLWSRKHFPLTAHSYLAPLLWLRENEPEAYQSAALKLTTPGYILYRLTGRNAVDPAVASGMIPLFSLEQNAWDRRICDLFSIPHSDLPELLSYHAMAGPLLSKAAEDLGLPSEIPVIVGTGDSMADLLSTGVFLPGQAAFTYGTLFGIVKCIAEPLPDTFCFSHAVDHSYLLYSGVPLAGSTLNWFRENLGNLEVKLAEKTGENSFDLLSNLGKNVQAGSEGLLAFPFTEHNGKNTETTPGAALVGLNLRHTRGHIYRSLVEGIAYEARRQLEGMTGPPITEIAAIGGGTRDTLWTQVVSDVIGITQYIPIFRHGAPLADAYLAGWGCGIFPDINQLKCWIKPEIIVNPTPDNRTIYQNAYKEYLRLGKSLGILNML